MGVISDFFFTPVGVVDISRCAKATGWTRIKRDAPREGRWKGLGRVDRAIDSTALPGREFLLDAKSGG